MAICNFRADAFGLDAGNVRDLEKIVELLEKANIEGLAKKDLTSEWDAFFIALKNKGLVSERAGTYCLKKQGTVMLTTCHAILRQGLTAKDEKIQEKR